MDDGKEHGIYYSILYLGFSVISALEELNFCVVRPNSRGGARGRGGTRAPAFTILSLGFGLWV